MHRSITMGVAAMFAALALGGCATLREHPTACRVGSGLLGAALGATGGGVGTHNIEKAPVTDGETAAGAGAGLAAGALIGTLVGYLACPTEEEEPPRLAPPPPPPPVARPAPGTKIVELHAAHFDFDKSTLKPDGERKVDEAVSMMRQDSGLRVSVEGHTDSIGSDAYNMRLGQRRADTVKRYMVQQGVESSRVTTRSFGEERPVASNSTAEGRAQNRRVEIIAQ